MGLDVFAEISIIIVLATVVAAVMRLLKQPLIIGYILTGVVLSFSNIVKSTETIALFAHMGVALLLFIVGLHMSPKIIKEVGKVSLIAGLGQVVITFILGYGLSTVLGFSPLVSLYLAVAFMFSSTIIVMKLLSDKKDLDNLYGKISIGILIFQDVVAVIALIIISSFLGNGGNTAFAALAKGGLTVGILILIGVYVLPRLSGFFAKSQEFLFLFSISWGLGLSTLFYYLGFSIEIGALIAGVILSLSPYHYEISSKMGLLRDFFVILFFVLLGSQIVFEDVSKFVLPIIVFSLFVFIGHALLVMIFTGVSGYTKRTGFLTGSALSQISEFSLIIIALGVSVGHLSTEILSLITVVGLITIVGSTYFMIYANKIYPYVSDYLSVFERKNVKNEKKKIKYEVILFGFNRVGYDFVQSFKKLKKEFLVIDYNPDVIEFLTNEKIKCLYGDVEDIEFLERLDFKSTKMVVSTIPEFETNLLMVKEIRRKNKKTIILVVSHKIEEANALYKEGATYVVLPHFLGGKYASMMIHKHGLNLSKFLVEQKKHIKHLKKRKILGHNHPSVEKNK